MNSKSFRHSPPDHSALTHGVVQERSEAHQRTEEVHRMLLDAMAKRAHSQIQVMPSKSSCGSEIYARDVGECPNGCGSGGQWPDSCERKYEKPSEGEREREESLQFELEQLSQLATVQRSPPAPALVPGVVVAGADARLIPQEIFNCKFQVDCDLAFDDKDVHAASLPNASGYPFERRKLCEGVVAVKTKFLKTMQTFRGSGPRYFLGVRENLREISSQDKQLDTKCEDALRRIKEGDISNAEILVTDVLNVKPFHGDALCLQAFVHATMGDFDKAERTFKKWISSNPQDPRPYQAYGDFTMCFKHDLPQTEHYFRKALSVDPYHIPSLLELGTLLHISGRPEQSEQMFLKLVSVDKQSTQGWCNLGVLQALRKDFKAADQSYATSFSLDPTHETTLYNYGILKSEQRESDMAEDLLNRCLAVNPKNTSALCHLGGIMHRDRKDNRRAKQYFERCLEIEPNQVDALCNMGVFAANEGDYPCSISYFRRALHLRPDHDLASRELKKLEDYLGQLEEQNLGLTICLAQNSCAIGPAMC